MNRIAALVLASIVALFVGILPSKADSYTYSVTVTNGQALNLSDPLPVSGYIEKIEVVTESASTTTVTVATYSSASNAIETFASAIINGTTPQKVFRPRFISTDIGGTNLTATTVNTPSNAVGTVTFSIPYERGFAGGNLRCAVTGTANDGSCPVNVTIYFAKPD